MVQLAHGLHCKTRSLQFNFIFIQHLCEMGKNLQEYSARGAVNDVTVSHAANTGLHLHS